MRSGKHFINTSQHNTTTMEMKDIADTLKATLDPALREPAEKHLDEIHKIIGFAPTLLQCIMNAEVEMPTRQAGEIWIFTSDTIA